MLDPDRYLQLDALQQTAGLRSGEFTISELLDAAIDRAERVNPDLNALIHPRFDTARKQAAAADADPGFLQRSPLAGLPFLIKDLSAMQGEPHGQGSKLFTNYSADSNSHIVQRFLDSGLLVLGKTNTPEFGLTLTTEPASAGAAHNPWNTAYSTGGSSGGAAAAVAAGIVPAAHASDGGGSIRIPASCCGLFGLKPSRGLTVIEPRLGECWSGMSVGHVVSRSVQDSAAYLDLLTLTEPELFALPSHPASFLEHCQQPPGPLRIALQRQHPFAEAVHDDCLAMLDETARLCRELGHEVIEIDQPIDYKPITGAMNRLISLHTWQTVSARLDILGRSLDEADMETSTRLMAKLGSEVTALHYVAARDALHAAQRAMQAFHRQYPVILSPVLAMPTAQLGWLDMNSDDLPGYTAKYRQYSGFTALYNGTGQPSMSVPLFSDSRGLPIGAMFSADWGQDGLLLQLARQLEQALPWPGLAA